MRYKVRPDDFVVEERARFSLVPNGPFALYRVHKRGVTTLSVQAQMARALGVRQSDVIFPALKDKTAVAVQHAAVRRTGHGDAPVRLAGSGFEAAFLGHLLAPLGPADLVTNHFTLVLRDLSIEEAACLQERLMHVARFGLPNYFDEQRFGSLAAGEEHIAKRILQRDVEGALRAYLSQPFAGDPVPVRRFKAVACERWGDWDALFEAAPRPSNFRSVLTYLRDHPADYRKALNLVNRRLLSLYLSAYQSLLWNRIAARYLEAQLGDSAAWAGAWVEIAGARLPIVYHELPPDFDRDAAIPLPHHRAVYADAKLAVVVEAVLAEEGFAMGDLKARILKKAYLSRGKRPLLLFPGEATASPAEADERFPGRRKMVVAFTLSRGSYATLVLKALAG